MVQTDLFAGQSTGAPNADDTEVLNYRMLHSCQLVFAWLFRRPMQLFWSASDGFDFDEFEFYIRCNAVVGSSDLEFSQYIRQYYGESALALIELLTSPQSVQQAWLSSREATLDPKQLFCGLANRDLTFKP